MGGERAGKFDRLGSMIWNLVMGRNKRSQQWARIVSRVLDPIWLLPLTLVVAVYVGMDRERAGQFLILLFFWDAMLPGLFLYWWMRRGKVLSGWDVKDRRERLPLFVFVVLAHLGGVSGAYYLGYHPIAEFLLAFWLMAVVYGVITYWWKISIHTGVLSNLVTFLVYVGGGGFAVGYSLVLMMVWARVVGRYHRLSQAVMGGVIPIVVLPWLLGLLV